MSTLLILVTCACDHNVDNAATFSWPMLPSLPNTTTLFTLAFPWGLRSMSWYTVKESTPMNDLWMGEAVPGLVVYSSFHLPSSFPLEVGAWQA